MTLTIRRLLVVLTGLTLALGFMIAPQTSAPVQSSMPSNHVLGRALDIELGRAEKRPHEQLVSSGPMLAVLQATGEIDRRAAAAATVQGDSNADGEAARAPQAMSRAGTQGCQNVFRSGATSVANIRVNQDCSLRRQAEEVVAINPTNLRNLIAGQNDSRIGFNHCGYDWSFDRGMTWGDQLPPFWNFVLADGHTADACSDPTATFDSRGNAYVGGILFDLNSVANAVVVAKSNAPIGGAFYHSPAPLSFQTYRDSPLGVVANDNDPNIFNDKELMVADAHLSSPKRDNLYVTWTRFNGDTRNGIGANSPIVFSQSSDGGATWSRPIEISGTNAAVCTAFSGEASAGACDQDQGSHPIVGPDGTIYVAFGNGNTPFNGINQHLIVSCPPAAVCTTSASWVGPFKITDDFGTQPLGPDRTTGCPAGRQCLPTNGYRLDDSVEGSVSVDNRGGLFFAWADFRNGGGTCPPLSSAATAKPPCDNDVFFAFSHDGGKTWSGPINLTPASRFGPSAQWQPWNSVTPDGRHLFVGYYDRHYGNCEFTGCNDITVARVDNPGSNDQHISYTRVTTASGPNLVPANNPIEAGFNGDYMWVATDRENRAHIVWADTRGLGGTVEEDIYYATVGADGQDDGDN